MAFDILVPKGGAQHAAHMIMKFNRTIEEQLAEDIIASYEGRYMMLEDFDNYFSFQYYK